MKCLILGGAGFIGSHIADALVARGWEVRIVVKDRCRIANIAHLVNKIELIEGDLCDHNCLPRCTASVEHIIHAMDPVSRLNADNDVTYVTRSIAPTLQVIAAAREVRKFVFLSSGGSVYGRARSLPITEDHVTEPISPYGVQKLAIEKYLGTCCNASGLDYTILRLANVYGERQRVDQSQGAVATFLARALKGEEIEIWGDGSVVRDYVYVGDVVRAILAAAQYEGGLRVFNIGSGHGITLLQLIKHIEEFVGSSVRRRFTRARISDAPTNVLNITRAEAELRWSPMVQLVAGLRNTGADLVSRLGLYPSAVREV